MPSCFVIMPITTPAPIAERCGGDGEHFKHVLEHLFIPAIEKSGHKPILPSAVGSDVIHAEIIRKLEEDDIVLCDMSCLNANVFFELGIRTALDKPVCLVCDSATSPPFDVGVVNYHTYDPLLSPWKLQNEIAALTLHLTKSANGSAGRNTLWKYFGLTKRAVMNVSESPVDQKLDLILTRLEGLGVTSQPRLTDAGTGERKTAEWIVLRANEIADEISAHFKASIEGDSIDLDLGPYEIGNSQVKRIEKLAKKHGYKAKVVKNGKPYSGVEMIGDEDVIEK